MDPSSPAKRRALAPLDANANAMSPKRQLHHKTIAPGSPIKSPLKSALGLKRPLGAVVFDENSVVARKKQCQEPASAPALKSEHVPASGKILIPALTKPTPAPASAQTKRHPDAKEGQSEQTTQDEERPEAQNDEQQQQQTPRRSMSPDTSSVFDNSAMDTSENTTILTEPDWEQARTLPPPRPRRLLTRDEARQKARLLRLKLGLANYKLQTGQEDVPLDRLQMKPVPTREQRALPTVTVQPPSSRDGPRGKEAGQETVMEDEEEEKGEDEVAAKAEEHTKLEKIALPAVPEEKSAEDGSITTCGGVASSLLSLARASSSVSASS